jgi:hypothetical protein
MTQPQPFDSVFELERTLGATWPNIRAGYDDTVTLHEQLREEVRPHRREDASIVVLGSLGRYEVSGESDIDWTYLVDGLADLKHQSTAFQVGAGIARVGLKEPGKEGIFGNIAFSHGIIQHIGGQEDTNANLTRRLLLLSESKCIGERRAYDSVIRTLLERYLTGDDGWMRKRTPNGVPRFLQNDISRYWRTIAVDFAYKQWTRDNDGWGLKSTKLRFSRMLIYASGLLYCFSLADDVWKDSGLTGTDRKLSAIAHLWSLTNRTPLDILAEAFMSAASLRTAAGEVFNAYDAFLGILRNKEQRDALLTLRPEDADDRELFRHVRELGRQFRRSLTVMFFENNDTKYPQLIKEYGVF